MFNATLHFIYFFMRVLYLTRGPRGVEDDEDGGGSGGGSGGESESGGGSGGGGLGAGNSTAVDDDDEVDRPDERLTSLIGVVLNLIFGLMSFVCM